MAYQGSQKVQKVMVQPINLIFRFLQNRTRVQVWLYENVNTRIEGKLFVKNNSFFAIFQLYFNFPFLSILSSFQLSIFWFSSFQFVQFCQFLDFSSLSNFFIFRFCPIFTFGDFLTFRLFVILRILLIFTVF